MQLLVDSHWKAFSPADAAAGIIDGRLAASTPARMDPLGRRAGTLEALIDGDYLEELGLEALRRVQKVYDPPAAMAPANLLDALKALCQWQIKDETAAARLHACAALAAGLVGDVPFAIDGWRRVAAARTDDHNLPVVAQSNAGVHRVRRGEPGGVRDIAAAVFRRTGAGVGPALPAAAFALETLFREAAVRAGLEAVVVGEIKSTLAADPEVARYWLGLDKPTDGGDDAEDRAGTPADASPSVRSVIHRLDGTAGLPYRQHLRARLCDACRDLAPNADLCDGDAVRDVGKLVARELVMFRRRAPLDVRGSSSSSPPDGQPRFAEMAEACEVLLSHDVPGAALARHAHQFDHKFAVAGDLRDQAEAALAAEDFEAAQGAADAAAAVAKAAGDAAWAGGLRVQVEKLRADIEAERFRKRHHAARAAQADLSRRVDELCRVRSLPEARRGAAELRGRIEGLERMLVDDLGEVFRGAAANLLARVEGHVDALERDGVAAAIEPLVAELDRLRPGGVDQPVPPRAFEVIRLIRTHDANEKVRAWGEEADRLEAHELEHQLYVALQGWRQHPAQSEALERALAQIMVRNADDAPRYAPLFVLVQLAKLPAAIRAAQAAAATTAAARDDGPAGVNGAAPVLEQVRDDMIARATALLAAEPLGAPSALSPTARQRLVREACETIRRARAVLLGLGERLGPVWQGMVDGLRPLVEHGNDDVLKSVEDLCAACLDVCPVTGSGVALRFEARNPLNRVLREIAAARAVAAAQASLSEDGPGAELKEHFAALIRSRPGPTMLVRAAVGYANADPALADDPDGRAAASDRIETWLNELIAGKRAYVSVAEVDARIADRPPRPPGGDGSGDGDNDTSPENGNVGKP